MSTPPPRRRRRKPSSSSEEGGQAPRRRKKRSVSQQKQIVNDVVLIRTVLVVGVVFAVIGGMFLIDWQGVGGSLGMSRSLEKLLKDQQYYQDKQIELIASLEDKNKAQAKAAVPQLNEVAKELEKISFEHYDWDIIEEEDEIQEHLKIAPEIREKESKIGQEISRNRRQHQLRLQQELNRIKKVSDIGYYVNNLVENAAYVGMRYGSELKLNKAKEGAFKRGYSPVTAGTKLTIGMQIQGIGTFYGWEDCVVKDVNQDGTVRVNFQDATYSEFFGDRSAFFDSKLDRDRLRIPDVITLTNTTVSGKTRRIDGTAQRPRSGVTGRRIESPPAKRPRSDRAF